MPQKEKGTKPKRPDLPPRNSSFSKRHASFNSPREVPLPSAMRDQQVFETDNDAEWELIAPGSSKLHKDKNRDKKAAAPSSPSEKIKSQTKTQEGSSTAGPIAPNSRPYSLPESHSFQGRALVSSPLNDATVKPSPVDRTSSASLPLPMQIPFSTLPKMTRKPNLPSPVLERSDAEVQLRVPMPMPGVSGSSANTKDSGSGEGSRSSSRSSNDSLPSAPASPSPPVPEPTPEPDRRFSAPAAPIKTQPQPEPETQTQTQSAPSIPPIPPISSRAAPMPPPDLTLTASPSGSAVASYRPPRTTYTPQPPTPTLADGVTAISRTPSLRSAGGKMGMGMPPPEPPVILPSPGGEEAPPFVTSRSSSGQDASGVKGEGAAKVGRANTTGSAHTHSRVASASGVLGSSGSGSSGSTSNSGTSGTSRASASYEPFLSHAPPPVDSWIEVETTQGEYRLIVRLPGFKRDGITLATKKRRILHVVADSWEEGGGHFERRISFGYDADLAQVRAEFDGEILRVTVPRRIPRELVGVPWGVPAPVGR